MTTITAAALDTLRLEQIEDPTVAPAVVTNIGNRVSAWDTNLGTTTLDKGTYVVSLVGYLQRVDEDPDGPDPATPAVMVGADDVARFASAYGLFRLDERTTVSIEAFGYDAEPLSDDSGEFGLVATASFKRDAV